MNEHRNRLLATFAVLAFMLCAVAVVSVAPDGDNDVDAAKAQGTTIDAELGVSFSQVVGNLSVNSPSVARQYTYEASFPDDLGLTVTVEYDSGSGIIYRGEVTVSGTPQYNYSSSYTLECYRNGERASAYDITGEIKVQGVSSIEMSGEPAINYSSDDHTATVYATVSPVDVQKKELVWTVYSGPGRVVNSQNTDTGGSCVVEATGTGTIVVRATHSIDESIYGEWAITSQTNVVIVYPIEATPSVGVEYTQRPQTNPTDTTITIDRVTFAGSEMEPSEYEDYIYVDEDGTIHATLPEAGTWEIFYNASYPDYTSTEGQIRLMATDAVQDGPPTVSSILAEPNLAYDRMWDFVATGVTNDHTIVWDFGDGETQSGSSSVGHTYDTEGLYEVTVTVTNSKGVEATASVEILVFGQNPPTSAYMNVEYYWAYRMLDSDAQYSFESTATWLTYTTQVVNGDRYVIVSGTPTLGNASTNTSVDCSLQVGSEVLNWSISISAQQTEAPVSSFTVVADSENPMTAILSYTGQNTSSIQINWGDGSGYITYTSFGDAIEHTYAYADTFTIRVRAVNNIDTDESSRSFTARYSESETYSVVIQPIEDVSVVVNNTISFSVTVDPSDASIGITGASWLHVDGDRIYGTPTQAGDYEITVIASYGNSSDRETFTIHVSSGGNGGGDDGGDDNPGGGDGGDDGGDDGGSDGEGTDWMTFAVCVIVMILLAFAFWYFQYPWLIVLSIIGIVVSAWYTGVF